MEGTAGRGGAGRWRRRGSGKEESCVSYRGWSPSDDVGARLHEQERGAGVREQERRAASGGWRMLLAKGRVRASAAVQGKISG